jgi:hypothetical protein
MWNAMLGGAVAVAVAIAGSSIACAQQGKEAGERGQSPGFSDENRTQAIDARLASLKERLRLTPEQEKNWPAYASAGAACVAPRLKGVHGPLSFARGEAPPRPAARRGPHRSGRRAVAPRGCAGASLQQP